MSVAATLAEKPAGCVIWIRVNAGLEMGPFFWLGGGPGEPLPRIDDCPHPLRATHNKQGERPPRSNHRLVPGDRFQAVTTIDDVLTHLFGEFRYRVTTCTPADTAAEMATGVGIVEKGGALQVDCRDKFPRATRLAVARLHGEVVGVGAIKRLWPTYTVGIAAKSGVELSPQIPELGYVAVDNSHRQRGVSKLILAALLASQPVPVFATTDDTFMKHGLKRAGFSQEGHSWKGQRGILSLWMKR